MKTFKRIHRNHAEVWEDGKLIDSAHGRENVWKMRQRHWTPNGQPKTPAQNSGIPTGFEKDKP